MIHENRVDHRCLVYYDKVRFKGIRIVFLKGSTAGAELKKTVQGLGLVSGGFRHPLCCPSRWRGKEDSLAHFTVNPYDCVDNRGFSCTRPPGYHHCLGVHRCLDRLNLFLRKGKAQGLLGPLNCLIDIYEAKLFGKTGKGLEHPGNSKLSHVEPGKINGPRIGCRKPEIRREYVFNDNLSFGCDTLKGVGDFVLRHLENIGAFFHKIPVRVIDMAVIGEFIKYVDDPRLGPHGGILGNSQLLGDPVRRNETYAEDVHSQPVGVFAHHLYRIPAVMSVNLDRVGRAHPLALKEHHDLPDLLLLLPGVLDHLDPFFPDTRYFVKPFNVAFYDGQGFLAKGGNQSFRHDRADPLDHA
ncbi:MAG: hypothetical protein A4E63_01926 [Syntrophorhabdus sp. PtaU1.Bin050]|nr:MAG: hypothetical protein A4E63_01926 [Syntrophorhabdus sp. PtaU1.Bin050]